MLQTKKELYMLEEYFALEDQSEEKHDYFYGELFAMAGGTPNHNRITVDLAGVLNAALREKGCEAFTSDLRVQLDKYYHYAHPDVVVVCGALEFAKGRNDTVTNPLLIAEVLSDATRDYDRGTKFHAYRTIETLQDYLLIEQKNVQIEHFSREDDGSWRLREYNSLEDALYIQTLQCRLFLKDVYRRVTPLPAFCLVRPEESDRGESDNA
ncbi:hypothetical protein U27_05953 [Candidatus Vecturithrix granuli]|uniref:Putative restriction endonuclease domain-containing protein n=1 Tax=Vecturithrix granuli TaxID=1499967 RepID=A0A081C323_VECG1|nr:hypothetical protein U27_05953 [Candidatus Vecturithrix granuli]